MNKNTVDDIKDFIFSEMKQDSSSLCVFENMPFEVKRIFEVTSEENNLTRGNHAHKECQQLLVCLYGNLLLQCTDGSTDKEYELSSPKKGVLIPPGIWAKQQYKSKPTILMVLCDQEYNENDYIRDFNKFKEFREAL